MEVLSSYFLEDALDSSEVRTHQTEGMMSKGRLLSERRLEKDEEALTVFSRNLDFIW